MNTEIIKSVPQGHFERISIEMQDWKRLFQSLVSQRKHIKYNRIEMPNLSKEIADELSRQNYVHLILVPDESQHFLVPL
ncbi:MAG: hypothetical protein HOP33_11565 [Verrucomicrobia bacterium]|nr:hypothetical protein [Verrucomicrobiota bacterium]